MRPILFHIFGIPLYAYGTMLAVAFLVGAKIGSKRASKIGFNDDHIYNAALVCFFGALLGARAVHVIVENRELLSKPAEWLKFWDGGLVFYGGFLGAVIGSLAYCRFKKVDFWLLGDLLAPSIALGHGIVRVGCFLNGCCHGKPVFWGVVFPTVDKVPRHPTQLYEAAMGIVLFGLLLLYEKRVLKAKGELILAYVASYGVTRFTIELIRDDWRGGFFLGLAISQWIGIAGLGAGLLGIAILRARARKAANLKTEDGGHPR
jgi:phosphatidylglycerol:prolipoprotein diacylglycerol transferase